VKNIKHLPKFCIDVIPDPKSQINADPVLRIRYVYSDPGPESRSAPKNLSILNPTNCFQVLGNMIRDVHPGSRFFPIPDPRSGFRIQGSKKHRIRNTALICNLSIGKYKSIFENKIRIIVGSGFRNQESQSKRIRTKKRTEYKHNLNMTQGICDIFVQCDLRTHI